MKGKQLTLQEVLDLEDGSKVWVEDDRCGFTNELCIYKKYNNILLVISDNTNYILDVIEVYENKLEFYEWIDDLIIHRNKQLQLALKEDIINTSKLEELIFNSQKNLLDGLSINVVLKVTNGSVIEQAYRHTVEDDKSKLTINQWREFANKMEFDKKYVTNKEVETVTPRLYLNTNIIQGLENLRYELKHEGRGIPRLSYIIKLVVFSYHTMLGL